MKLVCNIPYVPYFVVLSDYFNKAPLGAVLIFRKISSRMTSFVSLSCSRCITFNSFTPSSKGKKWFTNFRKHAKDSLDGEKVFRWFVLRRRGVRFQVTYLQSEKNNFVISLKFLSTTVFILRGHFEQIQVLPLLKEPSQHPTQGLYEQTLPEV